VFALLGRGRRDAPLDLTGIERLGQLTVNLLQALRRELLAVRIRFQIWRRRERRRRCSFGRTIHVRHHFFSFVWNLGVGHRSEHTARNGS
jgi:hypothetical protein